MLPMNPATPTPRPAPIPVVDLAALLGERREVVLEHRGERYRLSVTRSGKLILTK